MAEKTVYEVEVPVGERASDNEKALIDDTPDAYRVTVGHGCICIVHGLYRGRWKANASARWLVHHLIAELERLNRVCETQEAIWLMGGPCTRHLVKCSKGWVVYRNGRAEFHDANFEPRYFSTFLEASRAAEAADAEGTTTQPSPDR